MNSHGIYTQQVHELLCIGQDYNVKYVKKYVGQIVDTVVNIHHLMLDTLEQKNIEKDYLKYLRVEKYRGLKERNYKDNQSALKNGGMNIQKKEKKEDKKDCYWHQIKHIFKNYPNYYLVKIIQRGKVELLRKNIKDSIKNLKTKSEKEIITLVSYADKTSKVLITQCQSIILISTKKIQERKILIVFVRDVTH